MNNSDSVSGLIPTIVCAFNEADNIFGLVRCLNSLRYGSKRLGVVVVNDGSSDNTAHLARKAGAKMVISMTNNYGKATAFFYGLRYIVKAFAGPLLLSFDGDVQEVGDRQIKSLLDPFSDPSMRMTIGSVEGIASTSVLSGQRGYSLNSIKKLVEDPNYISALSWNSDKRLGYGLEVLLNRVVTGLPELLFPIHPSLGIRFVETNIRCSAKFDESKYRNKLRADAEISHAMDFIKRQT